MTSNEFEQRKRALDDQLRLAMDLLQAGHRAQLQALETVWRSSQTEAPQPEPLPAPPAAPRLRRAAGTFYEEILEVFPQLPEEFNKNDVIRLLGQTPDRVTLFRALQTLGWEGWTEIKTEGTGRLMAVYRKKHKEAAEGGG